MLFSKTVDLCYHLRGTVVFSLRVAVKRVVALSVFVVFAIPLIWIAGTGLLQPEGHAIGTVRPGQVDDDTGVLDEYDGPEYNDAELIFFGRAAANDEVDSFEFRSPFTGIGTFIIIKPLKNEFRPVYHGL